MIKEKLTAVLTASVLFISGIPVVSVCAENNEMRNISTMELVKDMGIGINLGNTFESCGDWIAEFGDGSVTSYETGWGSPVVTQQMIQGMANEGFGVVRVPVAWSNMMGENYEISKAYTLRVQEVVNWIIDADMYCIINIHWDNGWVNDFPKNETESMHRYEVMWTQIAEAFEDYGDHLIFESQNEELGWETIWNPWSGTDDQKQKSYELVNQVNQKFVDIIRSSGGNNPERHLLISGYNTSIDRTCDTYFKMPSDPQGRCAVSVHYYTPAGFAILEEDASWAQARSTWGTDADYQELNQQMDMMKTNFIEKGIPVIIGEYGCPTKGKEPDSVRLFLSSVCKAAYERELCPILWSVTGEHYDRDTCQLKDQELKKLYHEITGFDSSEKETESTPLLYGDADENGEIDILDVIAVNKAILGKEILSETAGVKADVNHNGKPDSDDSMMILKYIVGLVTDFS